MYLAELFEKYAEWKILRYFLENPKVEIHVKEAARVLRVSPGTASKTLNSAAKDRLLTRKIIGNVHVYSLNNKNEQVKRLKQVVRSL